VKDVRTVDDEYRVVVLVVVLVIGSVLVILLLTLLRSCVVFSVIEMFITMQPLFPHSPWMILI
jgi:hypothetical protein